MNEVLPFRRDRYNKWCDSRSKLPVRPGSVGLDGVVHFFVSIGGRETRSCLENTHAHVVVGVLLSDDRLCRRD